MTGIASFLENAQMDPRPVSTANRHSGKAEAPSEGCVGMFKVWYGHLMGPRVLSWTFFLGKTCEMSEFGGLGFAVIRTGVCVRVSVSEVW